MALGIALAALVGLSLGLLGGGGSVLTVPIFVYVLGFGAKEAIAASLVVVGSASLVGSLGQRRAGNVNLRLALPFGLVAMAGAYTGSRYLAPLFSGAAQLATFAVVMLLASGSMFRGAREEARGVPPGSRRPSLALTLAAGLAVGALTGLVGVGGGFLIVPALVLLAGVRMKEAVGTSLLVIAMNSASAFAGYLGSVDVPWAFLSIFTAVAVVGILAGTYLLRFVSQAQLKRTFAVFLLAMGCFILWQNRGAVLDALGPDEAPAAMAAH